MAVLIKLEFDVGTADQARAAVQAVHQEVLRLGSASGTGAGNLQTFRQSITQTGTAAMGAERGVHAVRSALVALASQATGTTGPIGHLASGILQFGGGSTLVLGVAAGLAALGLAYRALATDTEAATKAQAEFVKGLTKVGPVAAQRADIFAQQQRITDLDREIQRVRFPTSLREQKELSPEGREAKLVELEAQRLTLTLELERLQKNITEEIKKQGDELAKHRHLPFLMDPGALVFDQNLPGRLFTGESRAAMLARISGSPQRAREATQTPGTGLLPGFEPGRDLTPIVASTFAAIAAVASGGGAAAAIGALGSLVAQIPGGGLFGTILSGVGGLFGLFGGEATPVKVTNFKDLEGIQQPARTELLIVDSSGRPIERIMYDIGRRDARDVNPRLPTTMGV